MNDLACFGTLKCSPKPCFLYTECFLEVKLRALGVKPTNVRGGKIV